MNDEIKSIIERNLPAQVGNILRERLEQADKDAAKVKSLQSEVDDIRARNREHIDAITKLKQELSAHDAITNREIAVEKRERAIELETAKTRADNAERSKGDLMQLVGTIFRNTNVRETICRSNYNPAAGQSINESGTVVRENVDA